MGCALYETAEKRMYRRLGMHLAIVVESSKQAITEVFTVDVAAIRNNREFKTNSESSSSTKTEVPLSHLTE